MKCESCANLMQYYDKATNTDIEILKAVKNMRDNVDHISEFRIIGGEPLMNKKWAEITLGIMEEYPNETIYIYSNATICPSDKQLEMFKEKIYIFILLTTVIFLETWIMLLMH